MSEPAVKRARTQEPFDRSKLLELAKKGAESKVRVVRSGASLHGIVTFIRKGKPAEGDKKQTPASFQIYHIGENPVEMPLRIATTENGKTKYVDSEETTAIQPYTAEYFSCYDMPSDETLRFGDLVLVSGISSRSYSYNGEDRVGYTAGLIKRTPLVTWSLDDIPVRQRIFPRTGGALFPFPIAGNIEPYLEADEGVVGTMVLHEHIQYKFSAAGKQPTIAIQNNRDGGDAFFFNVVQWFKDGDVTRTENVTAQTVLFDSHLTGLCINDVDTWSQLAPWLLQHAEGVAFARIDGELRDTAVADGGDDDSFALSVNIAGIQWDTNKLVRKLGMRVSADFIAKQQFKEEILMGYSGEPLYSPRSKVINLDEYGRSLRTLLEDKRSEFFVLFWSALFDDEEHSQLAELSVEDAEKFLSGEDVGEISYKQASRKGFKKVFFCLR